MIVEIKSSFLGRCLLGFQVNWPNIFIIENPEVRLSQLKNQ